VVLHCIEDFVEFLGVLVCLVGELIARRASPDQFFRLCVEEIDDQGPHLVGFNGCSCIAKFFFS